MYSLIDFHNISYLCNCMLLYAHMPACSRIQVVRISNPTRLHDHFDTPERAHFDETHCTTATHCNKYCNTFCTTQEGTAPVVHKGIEIVHIVRQSSSSDSAAAKSRVGVSMCICVYICICVCVFVYVCV